MPSKEADAKRAQLEELQTRMTDHFARNFPKSRLWFFKDDAEKADSEKVAGYLGTDPVMFVGQRPSTGRGGFSRLATGGGSGFYPLLIDYGFKNAHITDVVKESARAGTPPLEQVERNWPFFQEELEIIRPQVVVALGGWVHWVLEQRIPYLIPFERIMHYSYRFIRSAERERRLREDLARIRRKLGATHRSCCRSDGR